MHTVTVHEIQTETRSACSNALYELKAQVTGFVSAGVVGPDGFEVAVVTTRPIEVSKLAALSSTLIAIGEAFSVEAGEKPCHEMILESEGGGRTLLFGIPVHDAHYAMFVIAGVGGGLSLGMILSRTRMFASRIQSILSANCQAGSKWGSTE
jgi:predicted regulator of Ras-like GTPase activity (Roadblock/LC7/MglB family)